MWNKIKFWFWWRFQATDQQKTNWQMITLGIGLSKNGKFIDVKNFFIEAREDK